ncbi:MAG: type IV pilin protein [Pseudobdellovibrionaceae bacterium]
MRNVGYRSSTKNQAGFSLVELMVVVAIIGILASLAIPSVGKYMAKARQSEAKTQLASVYTAEKAFFAEYSAYHSAFGAIGYSPEGKLRYVVGFAGPGVPADGGNGYNPAAPLAGVQAATETLTFCTTGAAMTNGCMMLQGADGVDPTAANLPATTSLTKPAFTAGAGAVVHSAAAGMDQWTVDQNKNFIQARNGIL